MADLITEAMLEYQPFNVFFDIELAPNAESGSSIFTKLYVYPQHPVDFTATHTGSCDGSFGKWSATLFDSTGIEFEPFLWIARILTKNEKHIGRIRYGYTDVFHGGARDSSDNFEFSSPWWDVTLEQYSVTIQNNGFILSLEGQISSATPLKANSQYRGNINQILQRYADLHNLVIKVNPTPDLSKVKTVDQLNSKTTDYRDAQYIKYLNEPDGKFIPWLCQNLVTPDGRSGYTLYYSTVDGQDILNIFMPDATLTEYEFTVQKRNSVVVEWAPDISFNMAAIMGGDWVKTTGPQFVTGEETKHTLNTVVSEPRLFTLNQGPPDVIKCWPYTEPPPKKEKEWCAEHMDPENCSNGLRAKGGGQMVPTTSFMRTMSRWLHEQLKTRTATLTIQGDPRILAQSKVTVTYYYPNSLNPILDKLTEGLLHYTSGVYYITEARHTISIGKYLTVMSLIRDTRSVDNDMAYWADKQANIYIPYLTDADALRSAINRAMTPSQPGPNPLG